MAASKHRLNGRNLWQGVDSAGFLTGERGQVPVLTLRGEIADTVMPISVGAIGHERGWPGRILSPWTCLATCESISTGETSSSRSSPSGELGGNFSHADRAKRSHDRTGSAGRTARSRIFATEMMKSGKKDLIAGNYLGEVLLVPNGGSAQSAGFQAATGAFPEPSFRP